jgi:hypothetical protein
MLEPAGDRIPAATSHLEEILALHDLGRDPGADDRATFEARCRDNIHVRGMHHHVFDTRSTAAMCTHVGLEVLAIVPKLAAQGLDRTGAQGLNRNG